MIITVPSVWNEKANWLFRDASGKEDPTNFRIFGNQTVEKGYYSWDGPRGNRIATADPDSLKQIQANLPPGTTFSMVSDDYRRAEQFVTITSSKFSSYDVTVKSIGQCDTSHTVFNWHFDPPLPQSQEFTFSFSYSNSIVCSPSLWIFLFFLCAASLPCSLLWFVYLRSEDEGALEEVGLEQLNLVSDSAYLVKPTELLSENRNLGNYGNFVMGLFSGYAPVWGPIWAYYGKTHMFRLGSLCGSIIFFYSTGTGIPNGIFGNPMWTYFLVESLFLAITAGLLAITAYYCIVILKPLLDEQLVREVEYKKSMGAKHDQDTSSDYFCGCSCYKRPMPAVGDRKSAIIGFISGVVLPIGAPLFSWRFCSLKATWGAILGTTIAGLTYTFVCSWLSPTLVNFGFFAEELCLARERLVLIIPYTAVLFASSLWYYIAVAKAQLSTPVEL